VGFGARRGGTGLSQADRVDTKWLEDFVVLAETRSFSRAAQMRHITQPAFSRRIQALEGWLGFDLINRATYPPSLTAAGESFYVQAQELLGRIGTLRGAAAEHAHEPDDVIGFALPHTLSLGFFPNWLAQVEQALGPLPSRARVGNVLDVVLWLVEGGCDLLICYHHPRQPVQLDTERFDMLPLGSERLAPYSARLPDSRPAFDLPGKSHHPAPYLAYTSSAYLARMAELALGAGRCRPHLRRVFETEMAEGLKQMALAGHGLAFLPESCAAPEAAAGRLTEIGGGWEVRMEIRAYRERPTLARPARRRVEQLWRLLEAQAVQARAGTHAHEMMRGGPSAPPGPATSSGPARARRRARGA